MDPTDLILRSRAQHGVSKDGRWHGLACGRPSSFESLRTPTFGRLLRMRLIGLFGWSREPESAQQCP
jgi:hypothetical protein